ncbi:MAG: hypothetical protein IPI73_09120 [Betaproteobacteria bacterium]|nr:hypothetical protein [Betaproteobacteria bacterium]
MRVPLVASLRAPVVDIEIGAVARFAARWTTRRLTNLAGERVLWPQILSCNAMNAS